MAKKEKEFSTTELAKRWDMHPQTLKGWRSNNRGPRYYKKGGYPNAPVAYKLSDVKKYEESHLDMEIMVETSDT